MPPVDWRRGRQPPLGSLGRRGLGRDPRCRLPGLAAVPRRAGRAARSASATRRGAPRSRLADALPPEWEGEDIAVVGVVDDLPQALGARHAFRVRRRAHRDPRRDRSGAAVARVVRAVAEGRRRGSGSGRRRRRALAARRPPEATARHRQPARLRRRGVAARERHSRDRLRARRRAQPAPRRVRRPRGGFRAARTRDDPRAHRRGAARRALTPA